jgi:hypothetical protein
MSEVIRHYNKNAFKQVCNPLVAWLWRSVFYIQDSAVPKIPMGASGLLKGSFKAWVDEKNMTGYVGIMSLGTGLLPKYAKWVEYGYAHFNIAPHFVSFKNNPGLVRWARRKGILHTSKKGYYFTYISQKNRKSRKRVIIGGIFVSGRAQPYLRPAIEQNIGRIRSELLGLKASA